ncbi:MAG: 30S ribosomal protein S20 [Proteobacteria bacterium]|nr:30S ribosomal protein S20 [Pseudomonadota bacterium]
MAHHKDAIKRIKQNEKRRVRNRHFRGRMRNQIKNVRQAVADGDHGAAMAQLRIAQSIIARNVSKGIIHRNQAARRVSRLNKAVKAIA